MELLPKKTKKKEFQKLAHELANKRLFRIENQRETIAENLELFRQCLAVRIERVKTKRGIRLVERVDEKIALNISSARLKG